jgi:hypothetical protein
MNRHKSLQLIIGPVLIVLALIACGGPAAPTPIPPTLTPPPLLPSTPTSILPTTTPTQIPPTSTRTPIPPTSTSTQIPGTVVPIPESDLYPTHFTVHVQGNQLTVRWDPKQLSKFGVIGPFVFHRTGQKNADGTEQLIVTEYGETAKNTGLLAIENIDSGQYILVLFGIVTETFSQEQISSFIEFEIP